MTQNLKSKFNLPDNAHAHSVEHTRKEYQCEQCFNVILVGSYCINYTEESPSEYGRNFDNKRFCSKKCFSSFLTGKIKSQIPVQQYAGTDNGDYQ